MEKEIYLTEAPLSSQNHIHLRQESHHSLPKHRPQTAVNRKMKQQHFPLESYYDDKIVKPGISLYRVILDIEERRANGQYNGPCLHINLPQTCMLVDNSNSMIHTENGKVSVQWYIPTESFARRLKVPLGSQINRSGYQQICPSALHSSATGIDFTYEVLMSNDITESKIIPRSQGYVCRRFIHPYNRTPNLFRLHYLPQNSRGLRKNYAFKLVAKQQLEEQMFKKKHKLIHQFLVDPQKENTYSLTTVYGAALSQCQKMTASLVQYIQRGVKVHIQQLVLDFIVDENRQYWLHEIKSIKSKALTRLWHTGTTEEFQLLTQKNNNSQMCRLCGVMHTRHQLGKIITNKLIVELVEHLRARGVHFQAVQTRKQGLSFLCPPCYQLIVAEHQLMNVQKQFSKLINLGGSSLLRAQHNKALMLNQQDFSSSQNQVPCFKIWRLFFYIQRIKNHNRFPDQNDLNINLQMKFKHFRERFTKVVSSPAQSCFMKKYQVSGIKRVQSAKVSVLQKKSRLLERKPSEPRFQSNGRKVMQTASTMASKISYAAGKAEFNRESYSIEKVKVYVFCTKKQDVSPVFANTELEFQLSIGDQRFSGRSLTLQALKSKETCQRHSSQIFLFDQGLKYCNLEVTVGLICDGEISGQDLNLAESQGIFYPTQPLKICRAFPQEWMEVFTKGQQVCGRVQQLSYQDIKQRQKEADQAIRSRLQGQL